MLLNKPIVNKIFSEKNLLIFSFLIICLAYLPPVILGENISFRIHDVLDSNIVWAKMVLEAGGVFASPSLIIPQMMNGVPLAGVFGSYDFSLILFKIFGPFWGYVANKYLMALIGFGGMYLLIKRYIVTDKSLYYIPIIVALSFGLLPFWGFSANVAGAPFAIFALLNLYRKDKRIVNWLILLFYAFYSSLVLVGVFILLLFTGLLLFDAVKNRKINWPLFAGLAFLSIAYIVSHLPLFAIYFIHPEFESVRKSFTGIPILSTRALPRQALFYFIFNDNSPWPFVVSLQRYIILPITLLASFLLLRNKDKNKYFIYLFSFITLTSIFVAFFDWREIHSIHEKILLLLPINLRRIYWLTPIFWYGLFSLSLVIIIRNLKIGKIIAVIALSSQLLIVLFSQEYRLYKDDVPFNKFYAERQFSDIKEFIAKDTKTYKVISVGLHPSISQYNGFYTLDGFSINYPLPYKYKFREIIKKELDRNKMTEMMYDGWGGWCYAFSGEQNLIQLWTYVSDYPKIERLDFDYELLKEMGGEYIISAAEIDMENNKELELLKIFNSYPDSHWTIYLYRVL